MSAKTTTCWRPFSDKSPWNTRIPANPAIDSRSGIMINDLSLCSCKGKIGMNINEWSIPVFYVDDRTTRWSEISYSYAKKFCHPHLLESAPIPKHAKPDPQGDAHLCIINESKTKSWDFWALKKYEGKWLARSARGFDLRGTGVLKPGEGACRAAGFPLIAGLIRPEEIKQGIIEHALVFAYDIPKRGAYVTPASNSDGMSTREGAIPEGARLQLNPKLDIEKLNLNPAAKIIARALQEYGMFLGDGAGDIAIYAENFAYKAKSPWQGILSEKDLYGIPYDELRVLKLPGIQNKGIPLDWPSDKSSDRDKLLTCG